MARIRTIKPEFFTDEDIAALPPLCRLAFQGLWCQADREGRVEDRPKRLKTQVLPYDDADMEVILAALADRKFIVRYEVQGRRLIQVRTWVRHQMPGRDEPPSELPSADGVIPVYDRAPNGTVRARIYARDRYACVYCGRDMTNDSRARCVDHVIPYARGGSNAESNLATACKVCNTKKGHRTPDEAGMPWPAGLGAAYENGVLTDRQPPVNGVVTGGQHPPDRNGVGNGVQEWERNTEEIKTVSSELAAARPSEPASAAPSRVVLEFPTVGTRGQIWALTDAQIAAWTAAYPSIDILAEAQKALAWVHANPGRRKTSGGMSRFLVSWLNRATDHHGTAPRTKTQAISQINQDVLDRVLARKVP
jgi:hypothetical protein